MKGLFILLVCASLSFGYHCSAQRYENGTEPTAAEKTFSVSTRQQALQYLLTVNEGLKKESLNANQLYWDFELPDQQGVLKPLDINKAAPAVFAQPFVDGNRMNFPMEVRWKTALHINRQTPYYLALIHQADSLRKNPENTNKLYALAETQDAEIEIIANAAEIIRAENDKPFTVTGYSEAWHKYTGNARKASPYSMTVAVLGNFGLTGSSRPARFPDKADRKSIYNWVVIIKAPEEMAKAILGKMNTRYLLEALQEKPFLSNTDGNTIDIKNTEQSIKENIIKSGYKNLKEIYRETIGPEDKGSLRGLVKLVPGDSILWVYYITTNLKSEPVVEMSIRSSHTPQGTAKGKVRKPASEVLRYPQWGCSARSALLPLGKNEKNYDKIDLLPNEKMLVVILSGN